MFLNNPAFSYIIVFIKFAKFATMQAPSGAAHEQPERELSVLDVLSELPGPQKSGYAYSAYSTARGCCYDVLGACLCFSLTTTSARSVGQARHGAASAFVPRRSDGAAPAKRSGLRCRAEALLRRLRLATK